MNYNNNAWNHKQKITFSRMLANLEETDWMNLESTVTGLMQTLTEVTILE